MAIAGVFASEVTNASGYSRKQTGEIGAGFLEVLSQVQKQSTTPEKTDSAPANNPDRLQQSFTKWQTEYSHKGVSSERLDQVQASAEMFTRIIQQAAANSGFDQPQAFVQSLSSEELTALQKIHGLADPIQTTGLSEEASLNLLLPPNEVRDTNHDGFLSVGAAKMWTFPPVDAPAEVKQAWDQATAGMNSGDVLMMQASFMPLSDIPGFSNTSAYLGPDASYTELTKNALAGAEFNRKYDQPWQYETRDKQIAFLRSFLEKLK